MQSQRDKAQRDKLPDYRGPLPGVLNRTFYSCVLSYLAMNAWEAGGDLALIQTSQHFSCKCKLVSIRTLWFAQYMQRGLYQNKVNSKRKRKQTTVTNITIRFRMAYLTWRFVCKQEFLWRSTLASLPCRGQVTKPATVKWSIVNAVRDQTQPGSLLARPRQ